MTYSLTPETQAIARQLVEKWNSGELEQVFYVIRGDGLVIRGAESNNTVWITDLKKAHLLELATCGLIRLTDRSKSPNLFNYKILLLQPLRAAVENDFVAPTLAAQGQVNITIQGDFHGSLMAALELNIDELNLTNNAQIADKMMNLLGKEFLQTQRELKSAIEELKQASEADREPKLGQVVSEFGRCLGHGANATAVIGALVRVSPILVGLLSS